MDDDSKRRIFLSFFLRVMVTSDDIVGDVSVARATRSFARERGAISFIRRRRASGVSESESRWRRR